MSPSSWKETLRDAIPAPLREEIDVFDTQLQARRQGKLEEHVFAETRLRRGVYGQRYDNGQRHDGIEERKLEYPGACAEHPTKGLNTLWDAPGMQRIKIPAGAMTAGQLEVVADLAEEYADGIAHATTRQDIQLHFVHIDDTPDLMRRLAAVGLTTREACGNGVRNITACPVAGVCSTEAFDISPYAHACAQFLLGHPDAQDFGRKFKIAYSGCKDKACGLVGLHDLGFIARTRDVDGATQHGFACYVGGGLGAVPHQAKLFDPFLPVEEMLPITQAICRVFARLGEKKNRARARIKFLLAKLGLDEFRRLVLEERATLNEDPNWTAFLGDLNRYDETPPRPARSLTEGSFSADFIAWRATNVQLQRQTDTCVVSTTLPLGDITAPQLRALADIARRYAGNAIRVTVDQNFALRWISEADLPAIHQQLATASLAQPGAGSIVDITACPGTDTCKLGIASSRGLAAELESRLKARRGEIDGAVRALRIKISGCFNSCGQHHVADLGFYGVSRKIGGHAVPHFQVVVGGQWSENAGSYGLAIGAVPSKRIPEVVDLFTRRYLELRQPDETFVALVRRLGKATFKGWLTDLTQVPPYSEDRSYYSDWGDPREFTIGDMGIGECAGEVVSPVDFALAESERIAFEAQIKLEQEAAHEAAELAYRSMLGAAQALAREQGATGSGDEGAIIREFRARLYDTKLFFDPYAGGKFAQYLFRAHALFQEHAASGERVDADAARQQVEEAQLFIEAAHACNARMAQQSPNAGR